MLKMIKPGDVGSSRFLAEDSSIVKQEGGANGSKVRMSET